MLARPFGCWSPRVPFQRRTSLVGCSLEIQGEQALLLLPLPRGTKVTHRQGQRNQPFSHGAQMDGWSPLCKSVPAYTNVRSGVQMKSNCMLRCPSLGASVFTRTFISYLKRIIPQKLWAFMTLTPSCAFKSACIRHLSHAHCPPLE